MENVGVFSALLGPTVFCAHPSVHRGSWKNSNLSYVKCGRGLQENVPYSAVCLVVDTSFCVSLRWHLEGCPLISYVKVDSGSRG